MGYIDTFQDVDKLSCCDEGGSQWILSFHMSVISPLYLYTYLPHAPMSPGHLASVSACLVFI
jgi:hypothetical protein